ncbi:hypothetical protein L6164_036004 [Bauhinia variegata]|uniref:Uncharacterized protein n=1 Tax=Bauhinia variegata TaxID=167791 RepID=A0ACB9KFU1_BAUVA|nr:hypothetical protein L6164_036004 [Bauhinia variegata]
MATRPTQENPAKRRNVPADPRLFLMLKNDSLTMRLEVQLDTAAKPPPIPLNLNGYISEKLMELTWFPPLAQKAQSTCKHCIQFHEEKFGAVV